MKQNIFLLIAFFVSGFFLSSGFAFYSIQRENIIEGVIFNDTVPSRIKLYTYAYSIVVDMSKNENKTKIESLGIINYEQWRMNGASKPPLALRGCGYELFYLPVDSLTNISAAFPIRGVYYESYKNEGAILTNQVVVQFHDNTLWATKDSVFKKYDLTKYELENGYYRITLSTFRGDSILSISNKLFKENCLKSYSNYVVNGFPLPKD